MFGEVTMSSNCALSGLDILITIFPVATSRILSATSLSDAYGVATIIMSASQDASLAQSMVNISDFEPDF